MYQIAIDIGAPVEVTWNKSPKIVARAIVRLIIGQFKEGFKKLETAIQKYSSNI